MVVPVTAQVAPLIERKLADGIYGSADDVIAAALDALEQRDRRARLRAAIAIGDEQLAQGDGIPSTAELMDDIEREAVEAFHQGAQPGHDVRP